MEEYFSKLVEKNEKKLYNKRDNKIGGSAMRKYDTILFDADGTLLDFLRSEREAICRALSHFGIAATDDQVHTYSKINDGLWKQLERGEIEKPRLFVRRFELFCQEYNLPIDPEALSQTYFDELAQEGYFLDGAEELCERLLGQFRMVIVTNGDRRVQKSRYQICNLSRFMQGHFISDEIGFEKPDVRFFEAVEKALPDLCRERTIIVGDSMSSDISGGIRFGIDTCWYNPKGKEAPKDMPITYIAHNFEDVYRFVTKEDVR